MLYITDPRNLLHQHMNGDATLKMKDYDAYEVALREYRLQMLAYLQEAFETIHFDQEHCTRSGCGVFIPIAAMESDIGDLIHFLITKDRFKGVRVKEVA